MVVWCKFLVWSVACSLPWLAFMWSWDFPFRGIDVLAWSIPAGAWTLIVSVGMRFKACKN